MGARGDPGESGHIPGGIKSQDLPPKAAGRCWKVFSWRCQKPVCIVERSLRLVVVGSVGEPGKPWWQPSPLRQQAAVVVVRGRAPTG